jgi:FkbM family methyltransferase
MKTIIEVGAHTGVETLNFLTDSETEVFAFEPHPVLFMDLCRMARAYPRLTVLPFAVDIGDNQEPLFFGENGQSTLQPPAFGSASAIYTMTWTIRLETFMSLYSIAQIDYLRIDAPLREEMILESLGVRIKDVARGRVSRYEPRSVVPAFLCDNGFNIMSDTVSNNTLTPDIKFWR